MKRYGRIPARECCYYSRWEDRKKIALRRGLRGTAMSYRIGHFYRVLDEPITLFRPSATPTASRPTSPLSMTVKRITTPPKIDGTVEDDEGRGAQVQSLFSPSAARTKSRTEIRLLYDRRHLYVAVHCHEPQIDGLVARETGRDGPVWSMDCLELMLNPKSKSRARRFHLIVAPAPNSLYDAQYEDASWTSHTQYAFQINRPAKTRSIELSIPFSGFGIDTPTSGSKWSANFGRERHAGQRGKPELLIWSPTRTGGFSDLTGKLAFE